MLSALAPAALALAALIVFGRLALRPLFHFVAETKSPEFFMAACLLVVLGDGLIAAISGLSMALGAFIAGLLLAETEYRREIEVTIEPFKGLLLGLYLRFGRGRDRSGADPRPPRPHPAASPAALIVAKALILLGLRARLRLAGAGRRAKWRCCSVRAANSRFVMIGAAVAGGLVDRAGSGRPFVGRGDAISMLAIAGAGQTGRAVGRPAAAPSLSPGRGAAAGETRALASSSSATAASAR